jgi:hypothetical protein
MPPPLITIPQTEITLEDGIRHVVQPFRTPRRAVTIQEYAQFARETGHVTTAERARRPHTFRHHYAIEDLSGAQRASVRATFLSWHDAAAYCEWAGGRLPSQEEWLAAAVRDWRTEVPRTSWVTAAQGQYEEDPAYIFIEGPEWTGTEGADDRAIVRGHPRYFLIEGWRSDPLQNRTPHPKSFADTGIGFRLRLPADAALP